MGDSEEQPPSQDTFQATQVDGDDDEWSDDDAGTNPPGDDDPVWGRLVNLGGGDPELLVENDKPAERGESDEFNEHFLGRNVDLSDIVVDFDRRISGQHCRLFCVPALTPPGFHPHFPEAASSSASSAAASPPPAARDHFRVYVENLSSNGTFVNNFKLKDKNERRLLHSGDEVALLKPKDNQPNKGTFTFVNLRHRNMNASTGELNNHSTGPLAASDATQDASSVPHYSLEPASGDQRNVHDYYTFTNHFLGEGNYGKVTRVVEKATGLHWACKEIDMKKAFLSGQSKEQLLNEFNIMKSIDTPWVIKSKEYFNTSDNKLLFILELIEGNDLFERIVTRHAKSGYPEELARTLMGNLLAAVRFLHDHNIVHRDLKPENIMLVNKTSDTDMKLTDFGLAKAEAQCKTFCGTPQYYAPEVLRRQQTMLHQGRYGPPADMWSVGVILYVVLSGSPAFNAGPSLDQTIQMGSYKPMTGARWSNVSESAKDLVRKLLTVCEASRLSAAQAQDHEWFMGAAAADGGARDRQSAGTEGKRGRDEPYQPDDSDDSPAHRSKKAKPNLLTADEDGAAAAVTTEMAGARKCVVPHSL